MTTTSECMENYFSKLETRNPRLISEAFHKNGFVIWGDRVWRGHEEIQEFYKELLDKVLVLDMEFESKHDVTVEEIVYVVWSGKCAHHEVSVGVGNFIVKDDAIYCLTLFMAGNF